ncbi:MAG TPA: GNAT family N-acetyltransferase [Sphingobacteriaceae bacterium]
MKIAIIDYQPAYQPYFEKFNKDWIGEYFKLEPVDQYVLENPRQAILDRGGIILFARADGEIIGTVALKPTGPGEYELTKMAVDKRFRGAGAGKALCQAAIDRANRIGARKLVLYSNTSLSAAIAIYRKLGFAEVPLEAGTYERADIKMELSLDRA